MGVFISHIAEEAPVADALKTYLKRWFGPEFRVFVSSDYDSIPTGEEWYRAITSGIMGADVVVVLLSRYSVDRRWINFESGLAVGAKVRILPLTIRSFDPGEVGLPLSNLHLRNLADDLALDGVVHAIAEATGLQLEEKHGAPEFVAQLARIEATLPVKSIVLEPLWEGRTLRFRLSNTGNRDVELIELEVRVPKYVLEPNWKPAEIPNVTSLEWRKIGGREYLIMWEQPFDGAVDPIMFGRHRTLPRVVSPHWTPRLSDLLRIPIRNDLEMPEKWSVDYKVVARGLYSEPGSKNLSAILSLE